MEHLHRRVQALVLGGLALMLAPLTLFADSGTFHQMDLDVPVSCLEGYDRLIDGLQEDPDLLTVSVRKLH